MAATIVTVTKVGASGTNIKIKINNDCSVPDEIADGSVQSFRTWNLESGHFFLLINDSSEKVFVTIPHDNIGWIVSSVPISPPKERFRIDSVCIITSESEI
jgi:hypothetical protein